MNSGKQLTKQLPIVACFLFLICDVEAQPTEKRERIEAFKVSYITKQLDLTTTEAQVFWPVYNELEKAKKEMRTAKREKGLKKNQDNLGDLTDKEVEEMIDAEIAGKQQELDLQKAYHVRFKEVLPIKKIAKLYMAEQEFKKILLKQMQENRPERPKPPNKPGGGGQNRF